MNRRHVEVVAQHRRAGRLDLHPDAGQRGLDLLWRVEVHRLRPEEGPGAVVRHEGRLHGVLERGQSRLEHAHQRLPALRVERHAAQLQGRQRGQGGELQACHLDQAVADQLPPLLVEDLPGRGGVVGGVLQMGVVEGRGGRERLPDRLVELAAQAEAGQLRQPGAVRGARPAVQELLGQHRVGDAARDETGLREEPQVECPVVEDLQDTFVGEEPTQHGRVQPLGVDHQHGPVRAGADLHEPQPVEQRVPAAGLGVDRHEPRAAQVPEPPLRVRGRGGMDVGDRHGRHSAPPP